MCGSDNWARVLLHRKFNPVRFEIVCSSKSPIRWIVCVEDVGGSFLAGRFFQAESDLHRVIACGAIDEMGLGAKIFFAAIVSETDLHGTDVGLSDVCRAVAKALRPKVGRLIAHTWNAPIFDERLPTPAVI